MKFELTVVTLFLMSSFFISSLARASYNSPEFLYQAKQGQHSLQLNLDKITHNEEGTGVAFGNDPDDTGVSSDDIVADSSWKGINLQLAYELGLSDQLALYVSTGYGSQDSVHLWIITQERLGLDKFFYDFDHGFNPLDLGLKYRIPVGAGHVHVQGNLKLSLFAKYNNENRMSGSQSLALRLGYTINHKASTVGAIMDLGVYAGDRKFDIPEDSKTNLTTKRTGGAALSAFYEITISQARKSTFSGSSFGAAVSYSMGIGKMGLYDKSTRGGAFREGSDSILSPNVSTADFRLYSRTPLSETTQLLGGLSYNMLLSAKEIKGDEYIFRKRPTTDELSNFVFGLGFRWQI